MTEEFVDSRINKYELDSEWEKHSSEHGYWSEKAADLQSDVEELQASFERLRAEIDSEIRNDPSAYGIGKPSETAIANAILLQPEFKKAEKALLEKRRFLVRAKASLNTLEHRKRALEHLVDLWTADYYSDIKSVAAKSGDSSSNRQMSDEEKREIRRRGLERRSDAQ